MSDVADLLQLLLPRGGLTVYLVGAYFDESGTHAGSPFLVVAGYIIEKDQAIALDAAWDAMLAPHGVKYMHMKECAHLRGEFKGLSRDTSDLIARQAIDLIKSHVRRGYSVSVDMAAVHQLPTGPLYKSPYTFACWQAILLVRKWFTETAFQGKVAYVFEAGAAHQSEANRLMNLIFSDEEDRQWYRCHSYIFMDGSAVPLQCADLLAWHTFNDLKRMSKKDPMRADFGNLTSDKNHFTLHFDERRLIQLKIDDAKIQEALGFLMTP